MGGRGGRRSGSWEVPPVHGAAPMVLQPPGKVCGNQQRSGEGEDKHSPADARGLQPRRQAAPPSQAPPGLSVGSAVQSIYISPASDSVTSLRWASPARWRSKASLTLTTALTAICISSPGTTSRSCGACGKGGSGCSEKPGHQQAATQWLGARCHAALRQSWSRPQQRHGKHSLGTHASRGGPTSSAVPQRAHTTCFHPNRRDRRHGHPTRVNALVPATPRSLHRQDRPQDLGEERCCCRVSKGAF